MPRALNWLLALATLAATVALYAVSYDTRRLEAKVLAEERALERAAADIRVLGAERQHLARPERLEPLAPALGMAPIGSAQYRRIGGGAGEPSASPAPASLVPTGPGAPLAGSTRH